MHRFFLSAVDALTDENVFIRSPDLIHQWTHVLRLQKGESVILLDNTGFEYASVLSAIGSKEILCDIASKKKSDTELHFQLIAAQSLLKNPEKFEWVLQKGTELGITQFIPLITDRTEQRFLRKRERLEKILKESAEQSGRAKIPVLHEPMKFDEVLEKYNDVLVSHPTAAIKFSDFQKKFLQEVQKKNSLEICFCIGSEGGFSEREIQVAEKKNAHIFSLGRRVLRSETAPLVLTTLLCEAFSEY